MSILSAAERTRPVSVCGSGASAPSGRYCSSIAALTASGYPASRAYSPPMWPSSSVNSRTSSDAWSAFASLAASSAASPPPRASTSFPRRSVLSANEPAPWKNVIAPSRSARRSIPTLTSRSNVNDASSRRPSTTFSTPARTVSGSPPFATKAKRFSPKETRGCGAGSSSRRPGSAAAGSARRTGPRSRPASRRGRRPRPGRRSGRSSRRDRPARRRSACAAPTRRARRRPCAACRCTTRRPGCRPSGCEAMARGALGDDLRRVDHRQRPANGPRKANAVAVPAHRLRKREPAKDPADVLRQDLGKRLPGRLDPQEAVALLELLHSDAVPLGKPGRGLLLHRHRWALEPLVRSTLGNVVDEQGEAPRRDQDAARLDSEQAPAELGKLRLGLAAGRSRQLLAADLNQDGRHRPPRRAGRSGARASGPGRCTPRARSPRRRPARRAG